MDRETNVRRVLTPEEKARRHKRLKRKRRIRLAMVITAFFLLLSILISPIIIFAVLRVKTFTVEGGSTYTNEEIIAASGIKYGKSLVFADLDEAAESIEKTLPYADNVKLTKKLPNGIVIRFEETSDAFAVEMTGGMYAITNSNLKVLKLSGRVPEGVALISGAVPVKADPGSIVAFAQSEDDEEQTDKTLELLKKITGAIETANIKDVNLIDVSSRSNIYLIYQQRIVMRFGDSTNIEGKLSLGQYTVDEENKIDPTQYGIVNLTIDKQAYFNPADFEDIQELVSYNEKRSSENADVENNKTEETSEENQG